MYLNPSLYSTSMYGNRGVYRPLGEQGCRGGVNRAVIVAGSRYPCPFVLE
jgi:hypothetical protein